jgi:KAP family P-loop domain
MVVLSNQRLMSTITPLTFDVYDKLGLKPFSEKLERFLMVEHDFVEGSLVVSLNAPFGAGKTTFLSMWKSDLDKRRESAPAIPKVIIINAWESDYCGDPLLSIVNGLIKAAGGDESAKTSKAAGRLREAAKDIGWFVTGLANNMASHWTGLDPVSAGELAEDKKQCRQPKIPDFIALYEARTKAIEKLKDTLREVFGGESPKAFVFVDELDRCRPDYAINYLETIKHVFDVHGLVFVLAVDYDQLECSAKALFGAELKFSDYFRKFVQRTIALPEPDESKLQNLAHHYVNCYLEKEGKRTSLMDTSHDNIKNIIDFIGALKMPPRQIQETFRIIGHTFSGDSERRGKILWCIGIGVILMSALKVANPFMYHRIGKGEATHVEVGKFIIRLLDKEKAEWWFCVYLTGVGKRENQENYNAEHLLKELGFIKTDETFNSQERLHHYAVGWGRNWGDRWKEIYQKIETANTF